MHTFTFLGRRVQVFISFIRFSKEFVDPRRFRTTGVTGAAQRWFFREPALIPPLLWEGLGCMVSTTFSNLDFTLSSPLGARTYSQSPEVARPSLSIRASHETAFRAIRMSACLVTGFVANKTLHAGCLAAIYSALSLWLQPSARRNLNLNAAASEISLEKYTGSL